MNHSMSLHTKNHLIQGVADFGKTIRQARLGASIRVVDAASLAGVSIQTLTDIEHGRPTVSIGKMMQVAEMLGVRFLSVDAHDRHTVENMLEHLPSLK